MKKVTHIPKVGEELFLIRNNSSSIKCERNLVRVTKVGRKYFYIDAYPIYNLKFSIDTWINSLDMCNIFELYSSEEEYNSFVLFNKMISELGNIFYHRTPLDKIKSWSSKQLEEIYKILDLILPN
jgi:hypothetical protein